MKKLCTYLFLPLYYFFTIPSQSTAVEREGLRNRRAYVALKEDKINNNKGKKQAITNIKESALDVVLDDFINYCKEYNRIIYKRNSIEKVLRPLVNNEVKFIRQAKCIFNINEEWARNLYNGFKSQENKENQKERKQDKKHKQVKNKEDKKLHSRRSSSISSFSDISDISDISDFSDSSHEAD